MIGIQVLAWAILNVRPPGRPPQSPLMWDHFCQSEHGLMSTAAGEECSWCGAREGDR